MYKPDYHAQRRLSRPAHSYLGDIPQQQDNPDIGLALMIDSFSPGDFRLVDILIDFCGGDLYRFASALLDRNTLPTPEAVLDLVSGTIAEASDSPCGFRSEGSVKTWLYKILYHRWDVEKGVTTWRLNPTRKMDGRTIPIIIDPMTVNTAQLTSLLEQQIWLDIIRLEQAPRIVTIMTYAFNLDEQAISRITGLPIESVCFDLCCSREFFYRRIQSLSAEINLLQPVATMEDSPPQVHSEQEVELTEILGAELRKNFEHRWINPSHDLCLMANLKERALEKAQKTSKNHQRARGWLLLCILCAFAGIIFGSGVFLRNASGENACIAPAIERKLEVFPVYYSPDKDPQRRLRLSLPPEAASHPDQKYPILFIIRSWSENNFFYMDPDHYFNRLEDFAHQLGYAVVTLTYRSKWINGGPWIALNDTDCALKWVDLYGSYYGLDVTRVILFGHDYGATLASNLGMANQSAVFSYDCSLEPPGWMKILGVITYGGGMGVDPEPDSLTLPGIDFNDRPEPSYATYTRRCNFGSNLIDVELNMVGLTNIHPAHWGTSRMLSKEQECLAELLPAYWVGSQDPPFLLMYGKSDHVARADKGEVFARYLNENGVPARYELIEDASHYAWGEPETNWQLPLQEFLAAVDP